MQTYAERLDILCHADSKNLPEEIRCDLNRPGIAEVWRRGSVVGSWLLDLTADALAENPDLSSLTGAVQDSGEGRWTVMTAVEEGVSGRGLVIRSPRRCSRRCAINSVAMSSGRQVTRTTSGVHCPTAAIDEIGKGL